MQLIRNNMLALGVCWLMSGPVLCAAQDALIVIGTTGSSSVESDLLGAARDMRDGLVGRGFAPDAVEILKRDDEHGRVTSARVLQSLARRNALGASDEFWLVLLGFSGRGEGGVPAFQVSGPRLTGTDLKAALDAIPAVQFVFVGTSDSGGFIPILLGPRRSVLAATREEGEIDLPRFPEAWATTLKERPSDSWTNLAARAAELTGKAYDEGNIAVGEHARLGDPATGRVLEAPFGTDSVAAAAQAPGPGGDMALLDAADIKVEIHSPNSEWENQPATDETRRMIEAARAAPNPEGFDAIIMHQRMGYSVGDDRMAEDLVMRRVYIEREDGVARWANFLLPQDPPAVTTRLEAARVIQPDGTSTVFNPAKVPPPSDDSGGMSNSLTAVFLPGTHAGCLVEIEYRTRYALDAATPEFSEGMAVQQEVPALGTELRLSVPASSGIHFRLRNLAQKPTESTTDGMRVISWDLPALPAFESLPYDPPANEIMAGLDISSLGSWDDLAVWYRRLTKGSDAQDDAVKAKAQELAAGSPGRMARMRRAFEFVSSLRYVAIEFGVNGIRPRTPAVVLQNRFGDCKDKANLLIALLADMGIDGRFCLLNRGSSTDVAFPSWQFNHAIAFVPRAPGDGQPDDLWLDTTDSTAPFGFLPPGDVGRSALVFFPDSARFITVAEAGRDVTRLGERWALREAPDGSWSGTLECSWSGLAEYSIRSTVRGLSPRQRDFVLQSALGRQLEGADFTGLELTPADDLSVPLGLGARISATDVPLPRPSLDVGSYFAPPARNRPLLINSGQAMHESQALELTFDHGGPAEPPAPFKGEAAGVRASISWERVSDRTWRRTSEVDIPSPLVAASDYAAVRHLLQLWVTRMTH
jgi:transglutaminase-like putative cysteine protease